MKKIFIAGKFNKNFIDGKLDVSSDVRDILLKKYNNTGLYLPPTEGDKLIIKSSSGEKYEYMGPFYFEDIGDGVLSSTNCKEVINSELKMARDCDIGIYILTDKSSTGTITELIYSSTLGKRNIVLYQKYDKSRYDVKCKDWFGLTASEILNENCKIVQFENYSDLLEIIEKELDLCKGDILC